MVHTQLDARFLRKLEHLMLMAKGVYSGEMMGGRRSRRRGTGLEFTDHKSYSPGDDLRYLDWNVLGRLDELFLKIFEMEEDLYVYILIDCSESMGFGDPPKIEVAKIVAACLAYIGLAKQDIVRLSFFADDLVDNSDHFKGRGHIFRVFDFLNEHALIGGTHFREALNTFVRYTRRRGIAIVISDFLDPAGVENGLKTLIHNKFGIYGLHVVDPAEEQPPLVGDLNLVDSESGEMLPVSIRRSTLQAYREFFDKYCTGVRRFLNSYNGHYIKVPTTTGLEDLILKVFRREGLLR
ncbi:MAG TPA: DUF58 domain-containing protein [Planctomycetota bacterium]|nr:DUF58 domain-containing protein [Planctomycetota bacterium]